jgi:tRNA (uracil-5-)-methyltransferase
MSLGCKEAFIYRVKVLGLPKHEMSSIKKLFDTLDLHKFKKAPKWDYAYLNFEVKKKNKNKIK